jgi:hypothetical protein
VPWFCDYATAEIEGRVEPWPQFTNALIQAAIHDDSLKSDLSMTSEFFRMVGILRTGWKTGIQAGSGELADDRLVCFCRSF